MTGYRPFIALMNPSFCVPLTTKHQIILNIIYFCYLNKNGHEKSKQLLTQNFTIFACL